MTKKKWTSKFKVDYMINETREMILLHKTIIWENTGTTRNNIRKGGQIKHFKSQPIIFLHTTVTNDRSDTHAINVPIVILVYLLFMCVCNCMIVFALNNSNMLCISIILLLMCLFYWYNNRCWNLLTCV